MADPLSSTLTIYLLATLTAGAASVFLWQYRNRTGALTLLSLLGGLVIWNGSVSLLLVTESVAVASLSLRTISVGIALVSLMKLLFVLEYTGREHLLRPRIIGGLAIPSVILVLSAYTNPGNLLYATLEPATDGPIPITYEFGPAVSLYLVYAYAANAVTTAMILGFLYRSRSVYRGQSLVLLGAALAPWLAHGTYMLDPIEIDLMPIGGITSGVLFTVAVVRYRLLDLMPVARDRVFDSVSDAIFVIDDTDRLIDINPEGRRLLDRADDDAAPLIGRPFPPLFAGTDFCDRYETLTSGEERTAVQATIGSSHFLLTGTPIDDDRNRHVGWLLIARDITDRTNRESKLEESNDRLDQFANLVSHDLRNPLTVASGYLELASETPDNDEYFDEIERSHERMETIIEDVLTLAREGAAVTDPEPVALGAVAETAWNGVDTGSTSIVIDADVSILADRPRMTRLLENLFRNSIDHGTENADGVGLEIRVGTIDDSADGSLDGFYVEDDGIGIPACRRERVFEGGYTTDEAGTGFGLSIVDRISAAHDWTSDVTESEAGGARFEFRGIDSPSASSPTGPVSGADTEADFPQD